MYFFTCHSHSIINGPSKLLISKCLQVARAIFTVIFTVKVSGTSIGAGFRAIRRKVTFRDLSTSIGSCEHRRSCQWTTLQVRQGPHMPTASNCISHCQQTFFQRQFYRHKATPALRLRDICSRHDRDNPIPRETSDPVVVPKADQAVGHLKDDPGFLNHARDTAISPHAKSRTVADAPCPGGAELQVAH